LTSTMFKRSTCRLCGSTNLELALALEPTPPANAFVPADRLDENQEIFPLETYLCNGCGHVQLLHVVDPEILFRDYVYVSGTSAVFVNHFKGYAEAIAKDYLPSTDGFVVDIGSNDGTLLGFFKDLGANVLGIDPARDIATAATQNGIETWAEFFDVALAARILQERGPADIVTANNVFAHTDHLREFAEGVRNILADDGVFVFEVSYLGDVLNLKLFDTIYHEHLAYHALSPLVLFFQSLEMEVIAANRVSSHGGSLRCVVKKTGGNQPQRSSVQELLAWETQAGVTNIDRHHRFAAEIADLRTQITDQLHALKKDGKSIAGFGAPAKATTLMYYFGLNGEVIDFIADDSPLKQGLYTPGLHIPVLPADEIYVRQPDYLVLLAWNFAKPIINNHQKYSNGGGHFIIPIPELKIV
jgi:SAM-dependent methyltransferase